MKKALFVSGGWEGHQPGKIVQILSDALAEHGLASEVTTQLDGLADTAYLRQFAVISPCWTMGTLTPEQSASLQAAVRGGVGLAGVHGGMGDAFRGNLDYEWMAGGHFVGHPHVGDYTVRVKDCTSAITQGLPLTFAYRSEQYYMMIDPAVQVLADTEYVYEGRSCTMPVAWVRQWGQGRVFYSALGHAPEEFTQFPAMRTLTVQGLRWAAGAL
ncbi:MAG: ThuA domain-containing protein [Opitutae bacterium]|nr:ThuA domain-containing protein [Opitutae bacterium]